MRKDYSNTLVFTEHSRYDMGVYTCVHRCGNYLEQNSMVPSTGHVPEQCSLCSWTSGHILPPPSEEENPGIVLCTLLQRRPGAAMQIPAFIPAPTEDTLSQRFQHGFVHGSQRKQERATPAEYQVDGQVMKFPVYHFGNSSYHCLPRLTGEQLF
jgi:hypothetical protein